METARPNCPTVEPSDSERLPSCEFLRDWVIVPDTKSEQMAENYSETEKSTWLDDLPVDKECSGVGFSYNQIYKDDGYKHEDHTFEDKCFRIKLTDECYLYGVFDGHCGDGASEFISQRFPAEILLGQLENISSDEEVEAVLQQAYHTVESAYFATMDDIIAERTSLQQELLSLHSASLDAKHKAKLERLRKVDEELSSGSSALVVLIFKNRLFVANVGNSRALLCRTENNRLRVETLNDDHTLENEAEVERLAHLGLPIDQIRTQTKFGHQLYTRCLGDYSVKGGYKDNDQMSMATSEPVIAEPEITVFDLDRSCNFLLLMSDGVYRSLIDATGTEHVNADIAGMVALEFNKQSTLNGVGQAVVDRITRVHHDAYALSATGDPKHSRCAIRDDMTVLIRNFNYPMRGQTPEKNPTSSRYPTSANSPTSSDGSTPTSSLQTTVDNRSREANPFFPQLTCTDQLLYDETSYEDSIKSNASNTCTSLELDGDGRLRPYVTFEVFDKALAAMKPDERRKFLELLKPKMDCETIMEHPESPQE